MHDVLLVVLFPVVAGAILGAGLVWWGLSWVVEGYGQISRLIRTAKQE